jgi:hypothetical protein
MLCEWNHIKCFVKKRISIFISSRHNAKQKRMLRTLLGRQRRAHRKYRATWTYPSLKRWNGEINFIRLLAPRIWSLANDSHRQQLLKFIADARSHLINGKQDQGVIFDFSCVETIYPNGGLLLWAETDRITSFLSDKRRITVKPPKNDRANQVLKHIGLYNCLGFVSTVQPQDETVIHWHKATGIKNDGAQTEAIFRTIKESTANDLYCGITEAMTNTVHHAYPENHKRIDGTQNQGEKKWWLFSQLHNDVLNIVFCDLGIGIPRSLPLKHKALTAIVKKLRKDRADIDSIKLACELKQTSTNEQNRGKGLPQILDAARSSKQGSCQIFSNSGQYGFTSDRKDIAKQFSSSIYGTLIDWRMPLEKEINL